MCNSLQLLELDALVEFGLAFVALGEEMEADALDVLAGPAVEPKGEQSIYNLSGQRVQTPSMKGIYVKGGKKYIVK